MQNKEEKPTAMTVETKTVYIEVPMEKIRAGVHGFICDNTLVEKQTDVFVFTKEELEERDMRLMKQGAELFGSRISNLPNI